MQASTGPIVLSTRLLLEMPECTPKYPYFDKKSAVQ